MMGVFMKYFVYLIQNYQKELLGALVFVISVAGGTYYYRYSRLQREKQAHIALSETLYEFNRALQDQTTWEEVGLAAHTGYRQHKDSSLATYFISIQAEAAIRKGDMDEAKNLLGTALHDISSFSPLYYPLKLKYARMLIDSKDENLSYKGFQDLEKLAQDTSNTVQDAALYYLGNYYAVRNEIRKAKETWQILVQRFSIKKEGEVSAWVELVQAYL